MSLRYYKLILIILFSSVFSLNNTSLAIQFDDRETKIDLPVLSTPNNAVTPQINVDDNEHVYVVWSDNRSGPYKVYVNTKFGDSGWSPRSVPINTGFPKAEGAIQDGDAISPQVCADNSGHVYVVWVDDRAVKAGTGKRDIYFRYSKDFGITWNAPDQYTDYRIDSDNPGAGHSINPKIACDENGNTYIVWMDDRNKPGVYEVYFRSLKVEFSKPADFIIPYQTPEIRLNTGVTAGKFVAAYPAIATDGDGSIYVAWQDGRNVPEEEGVTPGIYFNSSMNHGATWNAKATHIDTAPVGFNVFSRPVISSDKSGHVYVAWADNAGRAVRGEEYAADGTLDVYFNVSADYGTTWDDEDQRLNETGGERIEVQYLTIANNDQGIVFVAWADNRETGGGEAGGGGEEETGGGYEAERNFNIFANHSENYGRSFRDAETNIRIDDGMPIIYTKASYPVVQIDKIGNTYVAWTDTLAGTSDIFFSFSLNKGRKESWKEGIYWLDNTVPYGNSYIPVMTIDNDGNIYMAWQDDRVALATNNYNIYFISGFLDLEKLTIAGQRLGESCFIATAAYGSPFEKHVVLLREFRDRFLLTNKYGEWFVETYYRLSPPAAQFISGHPYLKPIVRIVLFPFVGLAAIALKTTVLQKFFVIISITIVMFAVMKILNPKH